MDILTFCLFFAFCRDLVRVASVCQVIDNSRSLGEARKMKTRFGLFEYYSYMLPSSSLFVETHCLYCILLFSAVTARA